jgi:hypothetical protein
VQKPTSQASLAFPEVTARLSHNVGWHSRGIANEKIGIPSTFKLQQACEDKLGKQL